MPNNKLAKLLTDTLPSGRRRLFNPWRDRCADDLPSNGPDAKLARLAAHLDCNPKFILCGEAPSYRGCRHSGIAFTSEHLLLEEGKVPRMSPVSHRLTIKKGPYKEGSATTVWKELYRLGIQERTVLWNALQMHPHELGKTKSNRTPTPEEFEIGKPALQMLVKEFPSAIVVAVGRKAERSLKSMGILYKPVRHPAYGGGPKFAQQLELLVRGAHGRTAVE
jgi:hypothetical protein